MDVKKLDIQKPTVGGFAQMPAYNSEPKKVIAGNKPISVFLDDEAQNFDPEVVRSFGEEWAKFHSFSEEEIEKIGDDYFDILPPDLDKRSSVLDVGCGSGRWTKFLSRRVGFIDAVDPSKAIFAADTLLSDCENVRLSMATSSTLPFDENTFDLVMSIGVLHHIPDTKKAMLDCVKRVKPGGYFYTYLYYKLDNRGAAYKFLFNISDLVRRTISSFSPRPKKLTCDLLAVGFYMPLVLTSKLLHAAGLKTVAEKVPLSYYRDKSFFVIRNDALDRFGTKLEQRFSKKEIEEMLLYCGLTDIRFSEKAPYWHVIARKK